MHHIYLVQCLPIDGLQRAKYDHNHDKDTQPNKNIYST